MPLRLAMGCGVSMLMATLACRVLEGVANALDATATLYEITHANL